MLGAPVALQALDDVLGAGVDAHVLARRQRQAIALAGHDGAQDLLPCDADHVGDDVGQLDVHLRQRLLHVLHMPGLGLEQHLALARQCAQHAHLLGRTEGRAEQAVGHQLLQPLAVQDIGLAARDVLHMPRVDQEHGEAARLQQLEQRDPVHAGGFHRYGIHAAGLQPFGDGVEVDREAGELAHRLVVAVGRHGYEVRCAADVDAGGVGVSDRQRGSGLARFEAAASIALDHCLLHHSLRNVAPHRVRRLAHSLKRNIGPATAYRQADSPMSMTSPRTTLTRGQVAPLLHRSSAAPHPTLPQRRAPEFLRRDLRQRADYFANPSLERRPHEAWRLSSNVKASWLPKTQHSSLRQSPF